MYTPAATRAYEDHVRALSLGAVARCRWKPDADARYALTVRLYFADARRVDADNCVKSLADALQPFVVRDDAQITEWHAYKYHDESEQPRAEVEVVELTRWASLPGRLQRRRQHLF